MMWVKNRIHRQLLHRLIHDSFLFVLYCCYLFFSDPTQLIVFIQVLRKWRWSKLYPIFVYFHFCMRFTTISQVFMSVCHSFKESAVNFALVNHDKVWINHFAFDRIILSRLNPWENLSWILSYSLLFFWRIIVLRDSIRTLLYFASVSLSLFPGVTTLSRCWHVIIIVVQQECIMFNGYRFVWIYKFEFVTSLVISTTLFVWIFLGIC